MMSIKYGLPLLLLNACAIYRAPSSNMLEKRADFQDKYQIQEALDAVNQPLLSPVRTEPVTVDIWVHPHELTNGDYFRGAWIRTVVTRSSWDSERVPTQSFLIQEEQKSHKDTPHRRSL